MPHTLPYNLVVSDMDGTLLRDDKSISPHTVAAVRQFEAAGGHFALATGRGVEAAGPYLRQLNLHTPVVLLNGSLLYDPVTGAEIMVRPLAPAAVEQVWPILNRFGLDLIVHSTQQGTTRVLSPAVTEHMRLDGIHLNVDPNLSPATAGTVMKVLSIGEPDVLEQADQAIAAAGIPVRTVRSFTHYLEILPPEGGKGSALGALLAYLGLDRSQCVAIGDWLNDLDLLAAAGTSVAMANAHPELKAVADHTTAGNMADGVAVVLEAIMAGKRLK